MTFTRTLIGSCPKCRGENCLEVVDTRQARHSTRRRKECRECGERCTTHEVSEEWFRTAEANGRLTTQLRQSLLTPASSHESYEIRCDSCLHDTGPSCSLNLPEYGTAATSDCAYWTAIHSPATP